MSYRGFARPSGPSTTEDWSAWLLSEDGLYFPVRPGQADVCRICWGPTRVGPDGTAYRTCWNCRETGHVAGLLPISYSWTKGLESAIYWAKNGDQHQWLNGALVSVLYHFIWDHRACIERRFGPIDVMTLVPSHPQARGGWDHLRAMHGMVQWPQPEWDLSVLEKLDHRVATQRRREVSPSLFRVVDPSRLKGRRVLLVDDTWTSGGTINSAAAALTDAGAKPPVALTIGRQFRPADFPEFANSLEAGTVEDLKVCALEPAPTPQFPW